MRRRKVCSKPGCIEFAVRDGRCDEHGEQAWVRSQRRGRVSASFRSNRFRVLRATNGRCAFCGVQTMTVDHRLPVAFGGSDDLDNLQPICESHHREKTAAESQLGKLAAGGGLDAAAVAAHVEAWTPAVFRYRAGG
jgi:5-methylcytosine-specific restriction protein A